ncbi:MAG: sarcosine oxidase subunit gamma family protein [Lautropia sp.]|nr:sarcosine oxidase subunit gamma family protein [Lautropia sp.]
MSNDADTPRTVADRASAPPRAGAGTQADIASLLATPLAGMIDTPGEIFQRGDASRVQLRELPFADIANLRGSPDDDAFTGTVKQALGLPLPLEANTTAEGNGRIAYWLGPDEWLLRSADSQPDGGGNLARLLEQALAGQFFATTDQSAAYSILHLHGPHARAVLAKGCPLDLHPDVFGAGQCAQSHYFGASILLRPLDDAGQAWEIIVRRSFADATARILLDAMEYVG